MNQIAHQSVVLLYGPTWDSPVQVSKHHLARYWSQTRPVLYVEYPPHPLSLFTRPQESGRLMKRYLNGPDQINESLWVQSYLSLLPYRGKTFPFGARWVNVLNQRIILPQLHRRLAQLGFQHPLIVVGSAHALPLLDALSPCLSVYHCSDDFTEIDNFPASFADLEQDLMRRCDLVIATAEELRRAKSHLHSNIHAVTNGAEVEHFARTQDPATTVAKELQGLPRPIIGYVGSIFEWIDQDMVVAAARNRPKWSFVFIGPVTTDISRLRALPNILLLGPRPYQALPSYLKGFDVTTVPFSFHEVTLRASPIKFYEYLASGLPVVATRLPDFEPLAHLTHLVDSAQAFVSAIERALKEESPRAQAVRMQEAQKHSWTARFARIDALIEKTFAAKEQSGSTLETRAFCA